MGTRQIFEAFEKRAVLKRERYISDISRTCTEWESIGEGKIYNVCRYIDRKGRSIWSFIKYVLTNGCWNVEYCTTGSMQKVMKSVNKYA